MHYSVELIVAVPVGSRLLPEKVASYLPDGPMRRADVWIPHNTRDGIHPHIRQVEMEDIVKDYLKIEGKTTLGPISFSKAPPNKMVATGYQLVVSPLSRKGFGNIMGDVDLGKKANYASASYGSLNEKTNTTISFNFAPYQISDSYLKSPQTEKFGDLVRVVKVEVTPLKEVSAMELSEVCALYAGRLLENFPMDEKSLIAASVINGLTPQLNVLEPSVAFDEGKLQERLEFLVRHHR